MKIISLITAAGFSRRFGSFKPLALYKNKSFIENIIYKVSPFSHKIYVVGGFKGDLLKKHLNSLKNNKVEFVFNRGFSYGMFSSIKCGMVKIFDDLKNSEFLILYQPVDIPHIKKNTYKNLVDFSINSNKDFIKPSFNMRGGHPVILKNILKLKNELLNNPATLKDVLKKMKVDFYTTEDSSVIEDFDFPFKI
ncbi:MAG: nucleotidyltransferase family protein [Candidatus Muiribacteriota bacterium]